MRWVVPADVWRSELSAAASVPGVLAEANQGSTLEAGRPPGRQQHRAQVMSALLRFRRRLVFSSVALLALIGFMSAATLAGAVPAVTAQWTPVHPGDFPDPSVLLYHGVYYGFATQNFASPSQTIINIQTSTSVDGVNWTASDVDALPQLPSWAIPGDTWAPSVAYNGSEFVMYYVATQASNHDECIGLAVSAAPQGPYVDHSSSPVICQDSGNDNYGGSIDPDVFVDKGASYLIWKSDGNHIGGNTYIWSQPLSSNLVSLTGSPTSVLEDDQPWQDGVVEGPDMVDQGGTDYLFYSAGDFGTTLYGIGYATCSSPIGPCHDASLPILTSSAGMSGPGGPSVFSTSSGQLVMAFAAWQGTTVGYLNCGIRPMYMAALTFPGGVPSLAPATAPEAANNPSCPTAPEPPPGYWQVGADGGVFSFGTAQFYGSTGGMRLNEPVVGLAATSDAKGYWLVAADGGVFTFGDAQFYGSTGSMRLNKPIVGLVPTADDRGYWLVASDGGVFTFGDAVYYGSTGGENIGSPVMAMGPGYLGGGYWLADSGGQVFSFGDARFEGQPASATGGDRITGMAATLDLNGYWLVSANGNVVDEGDAAGFGSLLGQNINAPIVGMVTTPDGRGYWLQGADGGIFTFGDAPFLGSMGGVHLNAPMVGLASA
jgi:GH43 family beta-xylosidase